MSLSGVSIIYGQTVLAELCDTSRNFSIIIQRLLSQLSELNDNLTAMKTYKYDTNWLFHCQKKHGLIAIVMASPQAGTSLPYSFLDDILDRFSNKYGTAIKNAPLLGMNDGFGREMRNLLQSYNSGEGRKTDQVRKQIQDAKIQMVQNFDLLVERDSKISELLVSTEEMQNLGTGFQKKSQAVKERYWWKNLRCWVLIFCILTVLILVGVISLLLYLNVIPSPKDL